MFIAALFLIVKKWKAKCPLADEWINIKRNEAVIHATTCMNLENIMLSERSQT